jgi:hypothetical protein
MKNYHWALIVGITLGIAAGQTSALAAIIYSDDFDDLSQITGSFGGAVAATDNETDGRTVLADGNTSAFVEMQKAFGAGFGDNELKIDTNPDGLTSFTVDTVVRRNQSVHPPATFFWDYRNDGNGPEEFQRLTIQVQSNSGGMSIDEYKGVDVGVQNHFGGLLSPHFPKTDSASDYSTLRLRYDYATSQFTVSTIIGGTTNTVATFALANPTNAEFDRLRYRWEGVTSGTFPDDSRWFVDSALICTDDECTIPEPPEVGVAITTGLVDNVTGFTFVSGSGTNYQLESTTDNVIWNPANVTIHGLGQTETTFDPNGFDSNKNYRIIALP